MKKPYYKVLLDARLKRLGSGRGWARAIGISPAYMGRIERGIEPRPPSDAVLVKWCNVFKVDIDDIYWRQGRLPPADQVRLKGNVKKVSLFLRSLPAKKVKKKS